MQARSIHIPYQLYLNQIWFIIDLLIIVVAGRQQPTFQAHPVPLHRLAGPWRSRLCHTHAGLPSEGAVHPQGKEGTYTGPLQVSVVYHVVAGMVPYWSVTTNLISVSNHLGGPKDQHYQKQFSRDFNPNFIHRRDAYSMVVGNA